MSPPEISTVLCVLAWCEDFRKYFLAGSSMLADRRLIKFYRGQCSTYTILNNNPHCCLTIKLLI